MSGGPEVKVVLTVLYDSDIHGRCARYDIWAIHAVLGPDLKVQTNRCLLKYFCSTSCSTATKVKLISYQSVSYLALCRLAGDEHVANPSSNQREVS